MLDRTRFHYPIAFYYCCGALLVVAGFIQAACHITSLNLNRPRVTIMTECQV